MNDKEDAKSFRNNLEIKLDELSKMEKNKKVEEETEIIKSLLNLSDEELEDKINNRSKALSDEELDKVVGGVDDGTGCCDMCKAVLVKGEVHRCQVFKCPICGESWPGIYYYDIHLFAKHRKAVCEFCYEIVDSTEKYTHENSCPKSPWANNG